MSLQVSTRLQYRIRAWRAAKLLVVIGLCLGTGPALRGDGGVFTSTKHGDPITGVQRLTGVDYPRGACVQCHYQHASAEGSATGPAEPYGLFAPDDNDLCSSVACHSGTSANHLYQGRTAYDLGGHATALNAVWPGPTPWARRSSDSGKCITCHDPHGYADTQGLIPSLGLAREEKLCLTCHDGSPANTDIQSEITRTYRHPAGTITGKHLAPEGGDATRFGQTNRHSECEDCHNSHTLRQQFAPPTAPTASAALRGVSYLQVVNGAAWTMPAYLYHASDDPSPISYEYQLCFKCHSSWTTLPAASPSGRPPTDKAKEFNPNNLSYHPVEAVGKQTGAVITASLLPPYTAASLLLCSDCHRSDDATAPRGPHGSNNPYLLRDYYATTESSATYSATDYALCFRCHRETALLSNSNTNFPDHKRHLQRTNGDQPYLPRCVSCHGNTHGSSRKRLVDFSYEPHLTFVAWTSKEDGGGTGRCSLTCHGHPHNNKAY